MKHSTKTIRVLHFCVIVLKPSKELVCKEDVYDVYELAEENEADSICALNKCKCDIELATSLAARLTDFRPENVIRSDEELENKCKIDQKR